MLGVHRARPSTVSFRFHFPAHCEFFSLDQLSFPSINSTLWRGGEESVSARRHSSTRRRRREQEGARDTPILKTRVEEFTLGN